MRITIKLLLSAILTIAATGAFAQAEYDVSGTVINEKGEPLKGATVFISGSERVMPTTDDGRFRFTHVSSGTFRLAVNMIGYEPLTRNILVKDAPLSVTMKLTTKINILNEVKIGAKSAWERNFRLFKENFLGRSANAKQCVILNPEAIHFSTKKGLLMADADELLIIENKRLGYRINYQLKDFEYNSINNIVLYNNECSFEELAGTEKQQEAWAKNRLDTYKGSFMHFLRSVHANNTLANGFITRQFYGYPSFKYDGAVIEDPNRVIINSRQVSYDSLITAIDTNLVSFKFKQFYIAYDPKKAMRFQANKSDYTITIPTDKKGSMLKLAMQEAIIDKKGSYTDYRDFFIQGYWARTRVGDQLPVEYLPPVLDIPRGNVPSNTMLTSLQRWTDSIPQEKAYLHMDKPYYALGDTIWFKGYLTTGSRHQLLPVSGAVYVELINEQNQPVTTLKLPVKQGTVSGNIVLNDEVKAGSYRVVAYTQWMRNAGEDYFFNKTITIGKPAVTPNKNNLQTTLLQTDIQFFPESGNLVNGITSRVGFKAIGTDGLGVNISGVITDNDNNTLAQINTLHAGMGNFLLRPLPGKTYSAQVKFADSTSKRVMLPVALDAGYVLSVYQPGKDSVLVRIQASDSLQHATVSLIVHSSGEIVFTAQLVINGAMTSVWLDKKLFPGGIAQFTLFNANNQPLNERIAFIKNDDHMRLAIKADKPVYKSREHVQLELNADDSGGTPIAANFSAAVIDVSKVPVDESAESTIFSYLLLSADIKGYIEKPNYYFTADTGSDLNKALDNLMLTQGYRRFEWRSLAGGVSTRPYFNAEGFGISISGFVKSLTHLPVRDGKVLLVSLNARVNQTTTTAANGTFKFDNLVFADGARFAVEARNEKDNERAIIEVDTIPKVKITAKPNPADVNIIKTILKNAEEEGKPVQLTGPHVLKQVNIKATRIKIDPDISLQGPLQLPDEESADRIITIPDNETALTLGMFLQAKISGVSIEPDKEGLMHLVDMRTSITVNPNAAEPVSHDAFGVALDGIAIGDKVEVHNILTGGVLLEDIARILVVRTNLAMANSIGKGIYIITKSMLKRKQYNPYIANIQPKGFNSVRRFYSPRYDRPDDNTNKLPDMRTTIFWDPYVNTDVNGKATLDFYNADGPGTYRVVVEGINAAGELGRQVFTYKVE